MIINSILIKIDTIKNIQDVSKNLICFVMKQMKLKIINVEDHKIFYSKSEHVDYVNNFISYL